VISGFTGVISYGLSLMEGAGGLRGWRWIFIMPGLITIVAALPIYFFVAEFPERARWLRQDELKMIQDRLEEDRGENFEDKANWKAFLSAATDWKVYVISAMLMLPNAGAYSMAFFSPSILASFGYSTALSQILSTPPTIFAVIMSITTGIVADRLHMRSPFIVGYSLLVMVGYALIGWGPNQGARLTGIFLAVCGNNCALPAAMAFLANNVVGSSKRQFAVPIQTVFGGLGGIIGSLVFRSQDAPGYRPGLYASFACMALNILAAGGLGLYFRRQNKKADEEGKILEGLPGYRYTL
jgi:cyanate permease